jgi:hypothetical protein
MAIKTGEDTEPLADPEDKRSFFDRIKSDVSRITAGNIDDPKSEAYKKYGAGRDAVKADVPVPAAPVEKPKPQVVANPPAKPNPIFAAAEAQGKRQLSGDASVAEDNSGPRTKPVVKKPRIVSKKELEDSGFDNLRDYLNDQKGLSRKSSDKHAEARKNLSSGKKRIDEGGKPYRSGGSVSSASSRADGIAQRGKTRGRMR